MISTEKVVAAGLFAALGTVLGGISFPLGPTRVMPLQHTLNSIMGILLGPWLAAAAAMITGFLRLSLGFGTIFALPGGLFGGIVVGYVYRLTDKKIAALTEPLGTSLIGGTVSGMLVAPAMGSAQTSIYFMGIFAASAIPGAIIGYVLIKALNLIDIPLLEEFSQ
ncbi:energy coupling factor transporter S component ThiW [Halarsenatibacter silvermanii]|uniref:Energy coupling factor transporter S component ThiW n=1 Tax=Halarsenatibacter silvermanii TaxID=321763 RepID=A0A1G9QAW5_9FIRM|nr:energy coupling factor transporter S component ThiW [Halarsenatibacter silvermanii]SDM08218.1 energy coupling factor transporter S component ThiW [Halarsenatibacter silvermanii]